MNKTQGIIVTTAAWVYLRPGGDDAWEIYKLNADDRVEVQKEDNGYYFIVWRFDSVHNPIYGWVKQKDILLDKSLGKEDIK